MLEIRSLGKSFADHPVVRNVDLSIQQGEFFSLLGPSGCGKTTLLRMLGGFEVPSSGQILLDGKRIDVLSPHQRQFNMVFQRYALFPHLSVRDNVAFGLRMKKVPEGEMQSRVDEMLALVKMDRYSDRSITTLSGGQQQRVALARALVNRPLVLLLDEPLSALDLKLRQEMQVELRAIQRRLKHTFIFVTHDQEEALTLSDRIAVMNEGSIEQVGTPQEIYERPATEFVARFIGSVNVLTSAAGVRALVRPEKIRILRRKSDTPRALVPGTIREILYQGPFMQILIQPKDSSLHTITALQPTSSDQFERALITGENVYASWSPEDSILRSEATTSRVET